METGIQKQMEVYQWIFKKSGFKVNDTGYFVFANAGKDRPKFDGKLEFELSVIAYKGKPIGWSRPSLRLKSVWIRIKSPPLLPTVNSAGIGRGIFG